MKKIIKIIVCFCLCLVSCFSFAGCSIIFPTNNNHNPFFEHDKKEVLFQNIDYSESTSAINNPNIGFYRPIYVSMKTSGVTYNKNIVTNGTQLYHLRIDISSFSCASNGIEDLILSDESLQGLNSLFEYLYEKNKNAIVRFAYDKNFSGNSNKEPSIDMILKHIEQICPILEKYSDTVTAVEVGLVGPWGEMHTSKIATGSNINLLVDKFLTNTTRIPFLVRTPKMIYNYLGITIKDIDNYIIEKSDKAYRLGMFNDGFLGSSSDLGTYSNREKEINWLSNQTEHLPYGGEVVIPNSTLHNIDNCVNEMYKIHLSYLNIEWNNEVISKWKNSSYSNLSGDDELYYGISAYNYIKNHMGYRFVVKKSVFTLTNNNFININLDLKNVGFGNLTQTKLMEIIFVNNEDGSTIKKSVGFFSGQTTIDIDIKLNNLKGNYNVYLKVCSSDDKYSIQFANNEIFDNNLLANKIGTFTI